MGLKIAFWILSILLLSAAMYTIRTRSVIRACYSLIICFLAVSGIFITLNATFLAAIQVMVYVGAIGVIIIMSVMMTKHNEVANTSNKFKVPAFLAALCFAVLGICAAVTTKWHTPDITPVESNVDMLGTMLFYPTNYILLTIIAALIILTAIVGSITVAREK